jgi:uncharacterized membrane protein
VKGINYQTHRSAQTFLVSLTVFFKADPVLFTVGTCGLASTTIRRDHFLPLRAIHFLTTLYSIGRVLSIVSSRYFQHCVSQKSDCFSKHNRIRFNNITKISLLAVIAGISIFVTAKTFLLITPNANSFISKELYLLQSI